MKSSYVTPGQKGRVDQYNNLMDDARPSSFFEAHEQATPGMALYVEPGVVAFPQAFVNFAGGVSPTFTAPSSNPRIDLLAFLRAYVNEPGNFFNLTDDTYQQGNSNGDTFGGQTFVVTNGSPVLQSLVIKLSKGSDVGTYGGDVRVDIYATNGSGVATGSSLGYAQVNQSGISTTPGEVTFTFGTPISLTQNTKYAFVVTIASMGASGTNLWFRLHYKNSNVYSGGDYLSAFATKVTTADAYFRINYTYSQAAQLTVIQGTEAASPAAPTMGTDGFIIAQVYLRPGMTMIRDTATLASTTQGYIYLDCRPFLKALQTRFGGNGSDGALTYSSGSNTIDLAFQQFYIKNYSKIAITGTASVSFINPYSGGTFIFWKCSGDFTVTSTATRAIDGRGIGADVGTDGISTWGATKGGATASSGSTSSGAAGGQSPVKAPILILPYDKHLKLWTGAGGGNGQTRSGGAGGGASGINNGGNGGGFGQEVSGWPSATSPGLGGRGGGCFVVECAGYLNITGVIDFGGIDGTSSVYSGGNNTGGGGAGGGGGCIAILYNYLTALTAGVLRALGGQGAGGYWSNGGGSGGDGYAYATKNTEFT